MYPQKKNASVLLRMSAEEYIDCFGISTYILIPQTVHWMMK